MYMGDCRSQLNHRKNAPGFPQTRQKQSNVDHPKKPSDASIWSSFMEAGFPASKIREVPEIIIPAIRRSLSDHVLFGDNECILRDKRREWLL